MSEMIQLLKAKFDDYDTVLKDMGYHLCRLEQQNAILRAKLERLESMHVVGSSHTLRDEL
jgi:hypothetical protein